MGVPIPGGFSDVEIQSFEILPNGNYLATIVKGERRDVKQDTLDKWHEKNPQLSPDEEHPGYIAWEFDINEPGYENRKQWRNTSLVKEGLGMLKELLLAAGATEEELNDPDFVLEPMDYAGRQVVLRIRKDKQREDQNTITRVMPVDEAAVSLP